MVGNPYALDKTGYRVVPYVISGSVGTISNGVHKDATSQADWSTKNEERDTMMNTFKMTGYQITTGRFIKGDGKSLVVTAPKADNYRGEVYICHNCFKNYQKMKQFEINGINMGEHFGAAVAACDLTGDGRDDLLVGAPNYGDRDHPNTGRVHVLITASSTKLSLQRFTFLLAPGRFRGAKFGSSVGCLSLPDSGKQVVVGAPHYQQTGAVFLFRLIDSKLELSQTITPSGFNTRAFGLRLSDPSSDGIAVAAPKSSEAFFIRVRPVLRFKDISSIRIEPKTIDRAKDKQITVIIEPRIIRMSAPSEMLLVRAEVQTDGRLTAASPSGQQETFSSGSSVTSELRLKYNLDLSTNNLHPVHLNVALKFSLPACTDSYTKPCPVFNNIPGRS